MTLQADLLARFSGQASGGTLYLPDLTLWFKWHHSRGTLPGRWQGQPVVPSPRDSLPDLPGRDAVADRTGCAAQPVVGIGFPGGGGVHVWHAVQTAVAGDTGVEPAAAATGLCLGAGHPRGRGRGQDDRLPGRGVVADASPGWSFLAGGARRIASGAPSGAPFKLLADSRGLGCGNSGFFCPTAMAQSFDP